ncbi:MAG: hemerythrin domain-containing protein [Halieaceae bacterium]|nr:hemerythrin domain-containing protein [Halieaceae bacterium]
MPATDTRAGYSKKSWDAVASRMRGKQLSSHPILATLYAEHRYMGTLLKLLESQVDSLEQDEAVDPQVLYESLHYMTHFPDAFHHPREDLVYARAGELDYALADSVDTLQRDHDYLSKLGPKALDAAAHWEETGQGADKLQKTVRDYVTTMYKHMEVEEALVFPEIERVLSDEDWAELEREDLMSPVPDPVFGPRVEREYRNLARKARRALRRGAEDAALVEWIGLEAMLEGFEVLAIAGENSRAAAAQHLNEAGGEAMDLVRDALGGRGIFTLPFRCTLVGASHYISFLKDLGGIAIDSSADLGELRRGVRQRLGLVFDPQADQATSSSRN